MVNRCNAQRSTKAHYPVGQGNGFVLANIFVAGCPTSISSYDPPLWQKQRSSQVNKLESSGGALILSRAH
ncbi:hypothetical protein BDW72DRAFT_131745 [Aspergillus terricola var. indicus]